MTDLGNRNLVQSACTFLTVAAYKWDSRTFLKKRGTILNLPFLDLQAFRYISYINLFHCLIV